MRCAGLPQGRVEFKVLLAFVSASLHEAHRGMSSNLSVTYSFTPIVTGKEIGMINAATTIQAYTTKLHCLPLHGVRPLSHWLF
jgi:hypothetical protein